jgi:hypothetical protein
LQVRVLLGALSKLKDILSFLLKMINRSLFFFTLFTLLISGPALASAGLYKACDIDPETNECLEGTAENVYFEGLVPCGKDVVIGVQLNEKGEVVFDEGGHPIGGSKGYITCQLCHFLVMVDNMVKFVMVWIVPLIAVAMFAIAGIMLYTAGGSRDRVNRAKDLFKAVVIGLAIIYGAWLLVTVTLFLIGVEEWTGLTSGWYKVHCPIQLPY